MPLGGDGGEEEEREELLYCFSGDIVDRCA